jgi:hypothetical protein
MMGLELLYLSGNALSGTIPNVAQVSSNLQSLSFGHNRLKGSIPSAIQRHPWLSLDLSFNNLNGFLHNEIYAFDNPNSSLSLEQNCLSGSIPSQLLNVEHINILEDNLFECRHDEDQLPRHDPHVDSFGCGSDNTNNALYAWIAFITPVVIAYYSYQIFSPCLSPDSYWIQRYHFILSQLTKWWELYDEFDPKTKNFYEFGLTMQEFRRWATFMLFIFVLAFMPIYVTFTFTSP